MLKSVKEKPFSKKKLNVKKLIQNNLEFKKSAPKMQNPEDLPKITKIVKKFQKKIKTINKKNFKRRKINRRI